jgi:hypothetical protein
MERGSKGSSKLVLSLGSVNVCMKMGSEGGSKNKRSVLGK